MVVGSCCRGFHNNTTSKSYLPVNLSAMCQLSSSNLIDLLSSFVDLCHTCSSNLSVLVDQYLEC